MINIACKSSGSAELTIQSNDGEIVLPIKVDAGLMLDNDDLFHDDFATGIKKWTVLEGSWNTTMKTAQGSGSAHFACVYNNDWQNYIFESTVRCRGSSKPTIDWLKAYIFFRVQDDKNYYRFGIQGDVGVLSLYKRVNGKWRTIHMVPFIPKKEKWYTLKVQVKGTRIICFIDNKRVMAFDDETFLYGGIGIGVLEDAQECDYKNIIVKKF